MKKFRVRLKAAWHCLRGHTVVYRLEFRAPIYLLSRRDLWMLDCRPFVEQGKPLAVQDDLTLEERYTAIEGPILKESAFVPKIDRS
jgi:hypothetical protein